MPVKFRSEKEYMEWKAQNPQASDEKQEADGTYAENGAPRPSGKAPGDKRQERPRDSRNNYERARDAARSAPATVERHVNDTIEYARSAAAAARQNPDATNKAAARKAGAILDRVVQKTEDVVQTTQRGVSRVRAQVEQERRRPAPLAGYGWPGGLMGWTAQARNSARSPARRSPARQAPAYRSTKWDPGFFAGGRPAMISFSPEHSAAFDVFKMHPINAAPMSGGSIFGEGSPLIRPNKKQGSAKSQNPFDMGYILPFMRR